MPSMERLLELRAAAFADDVEVHAAMLSWDEERLSTYFESGGKASAPPPPQRSLRVLSRRRRVLCWMDPLSNLQAVVKH